MRVHRHWLTAVVLSLGLLFSLKPGVVRAGVITVCASGCDYDSIQTAIDNANTGDTIRLEAEVFTEGEIYISKRVTIQGQGAGATLVQPAATQTASTQRIFHLDDGDNSDELHITIERLTLRHGNPSGQGGGAILNNEQLSLRDCALTDNAAQGGSGGGIINAGTLTIDNCTISENTATNHGGGIYNENTAPLVLRNSTVSDNRAGKSGGGIYNANSTVHLYYSTLTANIADEDNNDDGDGGGFYNYYDSAHTYFYSSIVAGNIDASTATADDCGNDRGSLTSMNYNLVGLNTGCPSDKTGDQTTSDAKLGPLALNGGRTRTHALLTGSPALDQVPTGSNDCGSSPFDADQRGKDRPANTNCDVGAYERQDGEETAQNASWIPDQAYVFPNVNVHITSTGTISPGLLTILKRSEYPGLSQDSGELPILWTLTANSDEYMLDLALCYSDDELGDVPQETLCAYRWNVSSRTWENQGCTVDEAANCVTVSGITQLSPWTVAGCNGPTSVGLRELKGSGRGFHPFILLVMAVVVMLPLVWCRRHRAYRR